MNIFEFVLALTSVISGLALAHMISGVVNLLRNRQRVTFSFVHALWLWSAFATTLGNWAADWQMRDFAEWPAWTLLLIIFSKILQYTYCAFVTPDIAAEGKIDLVAFHNQTRASYLWVIVVFCAVAIVVNVTFASSFDYAIWLRDSAISLAAMAAALLAIFISASWAQVAGALIFAALSTYFLLAASTLGAA